MNAYRMLLLLATVSASACSAQPERPPCLEVDTRGEADLGYPVALPIGEEPIVGGGAFPSVVRVASFSGRIASVVTHHREVETDGATRYDLVHHFDLGDGDSFWTEDESVCTPLSGSTSICNVTTQMRVVDGTGRFAGASGDLRNVGIITLTDPSFQTSPYGRITFHTTGTVCAPGL